MTRTPPDLLDALAATDPIDASGLAAEWNGSATATALLDALTDQPAAAASGLPGRRPRRWARAAVVAAAAASVAGGLVVVGLPGSTDRAYGFRQLDDGRIVIDWMANRYRGQELVEDLRDYGLDVQVAAEVPASPSMAGIVEPHSLNTDEADPRWWPPGVTLGGPDGDPKVFTWIIDPAVFDTTIPVDLYVTTPPGQDYRVSASVFEPGEPLADARCDLPSPLAPRQAAALAEAAGLTVTWTVETPDPADTYTFDAATGVTGWGSSFRASPTMPEGTVVGDHQINDHTVDFEVRPPGEWPAVVQDGDEQYLHHLTSSCPAS